jgi:hypothetical protein
VRIYTYVIVNDAGSAPNYEDPFVTLAVCKPKVRLGAAIGDLVVAFTGKPLGPEPHGVRWAGIVAEKLTFAEYWRDERFQVKKPGESTTPDNIYRPTRSGLVQVRNTTHGAGNVRRDLGGEYVLVFDPAWYFGDAEIVLPARFGIRMTSRRGHRVFDLPPARSRKIIEWLDREAPSRAPTAAADKPRRHCRAKRSC